MIYTLPKKGQVFKNICRKIRMIHNLNYKYALFTFWLIPRFIITAK